MARQLADDHCYHVLTRGNNRAAVFHDSADFQRYGQLLLEYFRPHDVALYHYCLMTNHVHLVVRAATGVGLREAMQRKSVPRKSVPGSEGTR
jgi:REP element-mobilizing transposase RayT